MALRHRITGPDRTVCQDRKIRPSRASVVAFRGHMGSLGSEPADQHRHPRGVSPAAQRRQRAAGPTGIGQRRSRPDRPEVIVSDPHAAPALGLATRPSPARPGAVTCAEPRSTSRLLGDSLLERSRSPRSGVRPRTKLPTCSLGTRPESATRSRPRRSVDHQPVGRDVKAVLDTSVLIATDVPTLNGELAINAA